MKPIKIVVLIPCASFVPVDSPVAVNYIKTDKQGDVQP
jgi:hypothetical protein